MTIIKLWPTSCFYKKNARQKSSHGIACWLLTGVFLWAANSYAETVDTLVVLPKSSGTAKMIYDEVLSGISDNPKLDITILTLDDDADKTWLAKQIDAHKSQLVIPIGNKSYKLCSKLNSGVVVVAGGISGKPNGIPTLSLTGDPAASFRHIKRLTPDVKDLRLVYSQDMNGWWYERAVVAGAEAGIEVIGYRADDLKHGVKLYEQMVASANSKTSAVWIPLRSIVPSKTIMPFLLEKAWAKKLPVISNNPSHTKLGGLMALYPEHRAMGSQLAEFALQHYKAGDTDTIVGTDALRIAINLRTSSHLGLRFDGDDRESFDRVFPVQR